MSRKALLWSVGVLIAASLSAKASLVGHANLTSLTSEADVIVFGRVQQISSSGPAGQVNGRVSLEIEDFIKGAIVGPRQRLLVSFNQPTRWPVSLADGTRGLFFLTRASDGSFEFSDRDFPRLVAAPPPVGWPKPDTAIERVSQYVGAVLTQPISTAGSVAAGLADDIRIVGSVRYLENGRSETEYNVPSRVRVAESVFMHAVTALRTAPVDIQVEVLKRAADQPASALGKVWAAGELLRLGDESQVKEVAGFLASHSTTDSLTAKILLLNDLNGIHLPSSSVADLEEITRSKDPETRREAIHAIGLLKTEDSLVSDPALAPLVSFVSDRDPLVRLQAATAICARTGNCQGIDVEKLVSEDKLDVIIKRASIKQK